MKAPVIKKKASLGSLVLILFYLFVGYSTKAQTLSDLSFGSDSTLDVISWNIEWFPNDGQTTLDYVEDILNELEADIIAIQEIDDESKFQDLIDNLPGWEGYYLSSEYLSLGYLYRPAVIENVSIYQILTGNSRVFPRPPLVLRGDYLGEEFYIINNHLKCCGDGTMNLSDDYDEETRRKDACFSLDAYIKINWPDENVIMLGDMNDILTDANANNVFQIFIDNPSSYLFTDMDAAQGPSADWSYPSWPSHLDHIMITNELFDDYNNIASTTEVIQVDDYLSGGWNEYESHVSDHRPVGIRLHMNELVGWPEVSSQKELNVYPNPFTSTLKIEYTPEDIDQQLILINVLGVTILENTLESGSYSLELNVSNLASGFYTLLVKSERGVTLSKRLVKQ